MISVSAMPTLFSVRGWTAEVNPAQIMFIEEMRATGVRVVDIFAEHEGCENLGEWADRAVEEILRQHAEGTPLHLLGYCAGGSLMHVAVRELENRDIRPAYIGFIDVRGGAPWFRLARGLDSLFRVPWAQRVRFQLERLVPPDRESLGSVLRSVVRRSIRSTLEIRERGWRSSKRINPLIHQQGLLAANWEMNSITSFAHTYNCQTSIDRYWPGNPSLGRAGVLRGGHVIRLINGTHETCIEPPYSTELIRLIEADRRRSMTAI